MFNNEIAPLKEGLMPWVGNDPFVLILGTLPGDESIEAGKYYQNPSNRFWSIMYSLFDGDSKEDRRTFITSHHIALWDVFSSCEIQGADDSSIRNAVPNDLELIFSGCMIRAVFTNGSKASAAYKKHFAGRYSLPWHALPSTSPANCRNWTYETLRDAWSIIK